MDILRNLKSFRTSSVSGVGMSTITLCVNTFDYLVLPQSHNSLHLFTTLLSVAISLSLPCGHRWSEVLPTHLVLKLSLSPRLLQSHQFRRPKPLHTLPVHHNRSSQLSSAFRSIIPRLPLIHPFPQRLILSTDVCIVEVGLVFLDAGVPRETNDPYVAVASECLAEVVDAVI